MDPETKKWPMDDEKMIAPRPPVEIFHVVRHAREQIEDLFERYGLAIRKFCPPEDYPRGPRLRDALHECLYRIFTDYDKFRTEEVEYLKRELGRMINLLPIALQVQPLDKKEKSE